MILGKNDEIYMRRCLELARKGLGLTRQNPLVGAVIVCNDCIIGEGYHHKYGGPHAEVNAINSVSDRSLLKNSTLYVNLEPCSHFGKTPPCSLLIKESGIPRVVAGTKDPNPEVSGNGMKMLGEFAETITGVLEEDCRTLNRRFFTYHEKKRPYVVLKWAQTQDGFIDHERLAAKTCKPAWITNNTCRMLVHKWRSEEIAIMAGTDTLMMDDPRLSLRDWPGISPVRIIPDRSGRLKEGLNIFDSSAETVILTQNLPSSPVKKGLKYHLTEEFNISRILYEIYKLGLTSLFVEGGSKLLESFISSGLWDEARVFTSGLRFGTGVKGPEFHFEPEETLDIRGIKLSVYHRPE
jgi:diaminohydroxyphosphoribosylaminopyrimidine deaminase / 5-amino-6-(5-phosphoribosylamino)uracil reductase